VQRFKLSDLKEFCTLVFIQGADGSALLHLRPSSHSPPAKLQKNDLAICRDFLSINFYSPDILLITIAVPPCHGVLRLAQRDALAQWPKSNDRVLVDLRRHAEGTVGCAGPVVQAAPVPNERAVVPGGLPRCPLSVHLAVVEVEGGTDLLSLAFALLRLHCGQVR